MSLSSGTETSFLPVKAPCQPQISHLTLHFKRTEASRRSKEGQQDGIYSRALCEPAGTDRLPSGWPRPAGPQAPGWGQRPEHREKGVSAHPRRHHHRSAVLCPPPTACRQGSRRAHCSVFLQPLPVCDERHLIHFVWCLSSRSTSGSAARCESSTGSREWRPWCTPWTGLTQIPTSFQISPWAVRSGQRAPLN